MGEKDASPLSTRLKREDCKRTKHDSVFSPWKILIGPSDWENYSVGKDGVERYRIHNLPSRSCPGIYELGIAALRTDLGRNVRKLDQGRIVAVYLGQADNVRTRLQHYGRAGSHLEQGNSSDYPRGSQSSCHLKGPGLFRETFSRGFPIVFRWASMENKKEAERAEAQLLGIFDYAWNKGGNGARRPNDIHLKLDRIVASNTSFINIARKFKQLMWHRPFGQKQEGITIKAIISSQEDNTSSTNDLEAHNHHLVVLKFERWKPRLLADKHDVNDDIAEVKSVSCGSLFEDVEVPVDKRKELRVHEETGFVISKLPHEEFITVCRIALADGSVCKNRPVKGRKRCEEHKWRKVNGSIGLKTGRKFLACGVGLEEDGSICMETPLHGRKRCELHKGKRIN